MEAPRSASLVMPVLATVIAAGLMAAAFWTTRDSVGQMRFAANTPRATLAAPRTNGPAIYRGTIEGPAGRRTPLGHLAAGYWYWVDRAVPKSRRTVCYGNERTGMVLRDRERTAPLTLFDDRRAEVSLLSDDRDHDWDDSLVVDIGATPRSATSVIPAAARWCRTDRPEYIERYMPEGAQVEVLACYRDGALHPCAGTARAGLLSLGGIETHQRRAAVSNSQEFAIAGGIGLLVVTLMSIYGVIVRDRALQALRAVRRAP